ncbi:MULTISPECIES: asparagine synthase-related protein [unclassified Streptomyces]|uniref:asparagine synthase-related protein n=1 Tax=unclassified Streptomyces TaxID=2593676 RepID=UPI002366110C|nr:MULTISPECIES: asparagine synthase-related protein [unclassified Streptomyces]MDF3145382.1 asparagine synthase-related protein [Streptomyces sp. T21Q-yed]WDF39821.1 asparagine synthase-related protein [Streptomyces sp. T12]
MLLTAFGMAGRVHVPGGALLDATTTYGVPGTVRAAAADSRPLLCQGPVYDNGAPLDAARVERADRLQVTGWLDLSALPEFLLLDADREPGAALAALQRLLDLRGPEAVRRLRGDFVLAHVAPDGGRLSLYRAVNALTPLFWRQDGGSLLWAADPAQLLGDRPPRLSDVDTDVLPMLIAERGMPDDRSWFAGVRRLPPGSTLVLEHGRGARVETFDEFRPYDSPPRTIDEAADGLRERIAQACDRMLAHESDAVLMLSGGIDSAAVAHEIGSGPGRGMGLHFTLEGFPGFDADREAAESVARACGLTWMPYEMSKHTRAGGDYVDIPATGALPQTHVPLQGIAAAVDQAEAAGARFVLSGLLADQIFAHDLQRGLFSVAGPAMLDPRVAGEPVWQTLAAAARTSFAAGAPEATGSVTRRGTKAVATARYLYRLLSGDPTTALPDRNAIVHPVGFTEEAGARVTLALRDAADRARDSLHSAMRRGGWSPRRLPQGITSLFMLGQSLSTANLQAAWINYALPKHRLISTPFADRDVVEYALALPARHRIGFGHGLTVDKFALRLAYADRAVPAGIGHRMQQARIDSMSAVFVNQNFELCRSLLTPDSLLCRTGVLSRTFIDGLTRARVHRNGEEIARLCVIERWLEGLDDA